MNIIKLLLYYLRKFMPSDVLKIIYLSWFQSRLSYGLIFWGSCGDTKLQKLVTSQKFAIRIVGNKPRTFHANQIFRSLQIFPLSLLYKKLLSVFFFKNYTVSYSNRPAPFHPSTRSTSCDLAVQPKYRKQVSRRSIEYQGALLNNILAKNHPGKKLCLKTIKTFYEKLLMELD